MKVDMSDRVYRLPTEQRGYYELASAIMSVAVEDYRRAKKADNEEALTELRSFFRSELFEVMSGVGNANKFLQQLDEKIDKEIKSGAKRKRAKQKMKCNR